MARPKIKHLALFARNPQKLAEFYRDTFEMEILSGEPGGAYFLSDGYITFALLPHRLEAEASVGLNHFGFTIDSIPEMSKKLVAAGTEEPKKRPSGRIYAESRAVDPEGNQFDIGEPAYQEDQRERRSKTEVPA